MHNALTKLRRGQALRDARTHASLSARQLAARVTNETEGDELKMDAVYSYENGKVLLPDETARRIAIVLGLAEDALLTHGSESRSPDAGPHRLDLATHRPYAQDFDQGFQLGMRYTVASELARQAQRLSRESELLAMRIEPRFSESERLAALASGLRDLYGRFSLLRESGIYNEFRRNLKAYDRLEELAVALDRAFDRIAKWVDRFSTDAPVDEVRRSHLATMADALSGQSRELADAATGAADWANSQRGQYEGPADDEWSRRAGAS